MATHRQRGFGTIIICALIRFAREQQIDRVYLGAQVSAVPFYEKLGFVRDGADYIEANILHTPMALSLS
jgi:predicted GNAT family N-acyltransferase